jgi:hypothetical protein
LEWLISNGWQCYWHFAFFFRLDNFRQNPENVFGGTGDMNVLAVPAGRQPPKDLPAISQPDEDWRTAYEAFFRRNPYAMP